MIDLCLLNGQETKWQDFKERVAQLTGGSASSQRLWQWNRRNNKTNRPDTPLDKYAIFYLIQFCNPWQPGG